MKPLRLRGRRQQWARGLALLLVLLAADYALYPHLSPIGGPSVNRGENGLWLRSWYYFGRRSDADIHAMSRRLKEEHIRYAYFHVRDITRDGKLRYHYPEAARRLVAAVHREAPSVKLLAWIYAGNRRGRGEVDLANAAVRRNMVAEALWLVETCGFDGVQWDYEICDNGDPDFLRLLRETRAMLRKRTVPPVGAVREPPLPERRGRPLLSAAVPMWLPSPFQRWGWSEEYIAQVASACDQIAVMGYDSGIYLPRGYVWLIHQQAVHVTRAVAQASPRCRVLIGVPTYARGGLSHHAWAENIRLALKGVREGLVDPRAVPTVFAGVAPFADYTTQPEEWQSYGDLWLDPGTERSR